MSEHDEGTSYEQPTEPSQYGPSPDAPWWTPADGDASRTQQTQPAPTARAPKRRRIGTAALLVACLAAGATGAGIALAVDGSNTSTQATSAASQPAAEPPAVGAAAPAPAVTGSAVAAAARLSPSVVTIAVTGAQAGGQAVADTGSGIAIRQGGYIVTNNHVIAAAALAGSGGSVDVTTADGTTRPAKIVGTDPTSDLAVVQVQGGNLPVATFADSSKLAVGQPVIAVGAPLGLANTVTEGIVSTLGRPVATGEPGAPKAQSVIDAIQTDAAINPGNSGGALADLSGQVIGVNSAIATTGSAGSGQPGSIGVGFAIPANQVVKVADQLIAGGHATHPQLGVSIQNAPADNRGAPGKGAQVGQVESGSPAAAAGLQPGDVVTKLDNRVVTDADTLIVATRNHDVGDTVTLTYLRGGATKTGQATLTAAPQPQPR